jgi:oligopeptide transport system substrate-binding protein
MHFSDLAKEEASLKATSMFRQIARISAIAVMALFGACENNPHPEPLRKTRPDGSPWVVRYIALRTDPRSFDPQYTYDQMSRKVIESVYDCWLEYHPMKTDPFELSPCIFEEMPIKEDGGMSYLCRIKRGIMFHDDPCFPNGKGREIVAEDMQYVFQRIADPAVESPFQSTFEAYIVGLAETIEETRKTGKLDYDKQRISGIEVIDRYTVRLKLKQNYPQILYWLAFQCTAPVAREAVEYYHGKELPNGERREDFRKFASVGTGPYRVVSYVPKSRVILERVPGYQTTVFPSDSFPPEKAEWLKQFAGKPIPFIDEIQMPIMLENIPRFVLTRQGYLDGMSVDKDAFNAMVSPTKSLSPEYQARGMTLEKDFELSTFWITFNMEDPVVGKNVKLREAIACAYDSARYSEIFYAGVAPVATQLLPPGIFGFEKDRPDPHPFNLEKAKQLLAEAGYPGGRDKDGRQLELVVTAQADGSEQRQRAEFDQRAMESLGIRVKVNGVTFAHMQTLEDRGDFQIVSGTGWGADYPDPENYFMLFYSKNIPPVGKNYARYKNPEFDRVFEKMSVAENGPERMEMVRQLQGMLDKDCPVFFTFNKAFYGAVQPWSKRTHNNLMWEVEGGMKYLYCDAEMRERLQKEWNRPAIWPAFVIGAGLVGAVIAFVRAVRRTRNQTA